MMRWFRRIVSLFIVLVIVAVVPLIAVAWIRSWHWQWPTADQTSRWLEQPLTRGSLTAVGACVLLLAWVLAVRQVLYWVRRTNVTARRLLQGLQMLTPAHVTARTFAGVAVVAVPTVAVAPAVVDAEAVTGLPAQADDASDDQREAGNSAARGVELPGGGWIPRPTALAVAAVAAVIWASRRRYNATSTRPEQHRDDVDLRPLPPTADVITAAVTADHPQLPPPPTGSAALDALPNGHLTLGGPGAADAARGLLTSILLHAALNPGDLPEVAIDRHTLRLLLGRDLGEPVPRGLTADATVRRASFTVTRRPGILGDPHAVATNAAVSPEVVMTVVNLDAHTRGTHHWHVEADGTVSGTSSDRPPRLSVLPKPACADLILLIQQGTSDGTSSPPNQAPATPTQPGSPAVTGLLNLLGGCRLSINGQAIRLRRSAGLQILAFLATHPEGATTTELIQALWPGNPPSTITKRLHTTLSDLRQQLFGLGEEAIIRRDDRYHLNSDAVGVDLGHLRNSLTAAATAITPSQRQAAIDAITSSQPPILAPGYGWPWLQPIREQLRRDFIDTCLLLADNADVAQAADLIHAAAVADPQNTDVRHRAVALLRATGEAASPNVHLGRGADDS